MYKHNLVISITLLISPISLLNAAPCYTDTPEGCAENIEAILVKKRTAISGEICTEYINDLNKKVVYCSVPKVEIQESTELANDTKPATSKTSPSLPKDAPITVNNITYNTIYSQTESVQQEPVIQRVRDAYWQGYYQNYNNRPFYGYGHRPPPPPPRPPHLNNNGKQPIIGRPTGKIDKHRTSSISQFQRPQHPFIGRPRPPMYDQPPPSQNMQLPNNNRNPVQSRPIRR